MTWVKFPKIHLFWGKWAIFLQFQIETGILNFWNGSKDLFQNVLYNEWLQVGQNDRREITFFGDNYGN